MTLVLETKDQEVDGRIGPVMITPRLSEDYWLFRVRLSDRQAMLGFPKFTTIGIGFAVETDWNTNLPYDCDLERIFQHIAHNKGDESISDEDCREAIRMIQAAATALRNTADRDIGEIETINDCFVGTLADGYVVFALPPAPMDRAKAIRMAAWVVAMTDGEADFHAVLTAIKAT